MLARIGVALLLVGLSASGTAAQQNSSPDSLLAYWLRRGALANWQPFHLYRGCPNLDEWQRRGIEKLMAADLSLERTRDLAGAWMFPLKDCNDPRLEQWYFKHVDALIRQGNPQGRLLTFWTALRHGDSPRIRDYLRNLMLDTSKPEEYRNEAGGALFSRLGPEEYFQEYLSAFETRSMPFEMQVGQTTMLLERNGEQLLREVGKRVQLNPALADQGAFAQIVEASDRYVSAAARRSLGEALQEGLRRRGSSGNQRSRLEGHAQFLMRPAR